ncbi:MAG TPA: hypothetical protein VM529_20250 [Gemmata sp.]|jgi:hypothetical protein|nr:hypothetical protein [Gemmata sp.]
MSETPAPNSRDVDRLIYAGLLGLAAASVIQLTERESIAVSQQVAVFAFAAAIPLLTVGLVTDYARRAGVHVPHWRDALGLLASLLAVVGLGAMFFHFGTWPGVVFSVGAILSLLLVRQL